MSHHRNLPPRTRPDLGRPAGPRTRRDHRPRVTEEEQEAVVEGVTGLRPEVPVVEEPYVPAGRPDWLVAMAAGGAAALAGWVALAAVASIAWLSTPVGSYADVLRVATQVWLAGHGGGLVADGSRWTLVPYGLTLALGVLVALLGSVVLRRLGDGTEDSPGQARRGLSRTALVVATYAGVLGLVGVGVGGPVQGARALGGALLVAAAAAWWSRWRNHATVVAVRFPAVVGALARALGAGLAILVAVGSAALVTGLVMHRGQLVVLTEGLGGGMLGGVGAVLVQAVYVPTFVVWSTSYTLGAGFGLGDGSLVSPADTHVGLLPAWPIAAALPTPGPGSPLDLAWLAGGIVAGGFAAWLFLRRSSWVRPDTTMLAGGVVGIALGLLTTLLGLLSRGDLGVARLVGLGPRLVELLVLATVLCTVGGLVVGLATGIARTLRRDRPIQQPPAADDDSEGDAPVLLAPPGPRSDSPDEAEPA